MSSAMSGDRVVTADLGGQGIQNWGGITVGGDLNIGSQHHSDTTRERFADPRYRNKLRAEFLRRLRTSPYEERKDRNPTRAEGTCEWFAAHDRFRNWREQSSALLWVSADPGCGKSVLARYLVDDVLPSSTTRTTCYFFFKDDYEDQKALEGALCCLLHQLFTQQPSLLSDEILADFEQEGHHLFASFSKLWDLFVTSARHHKDGEIVCVLDALDECAGHTHLTTALTRLYGKGKRAPTLKVLVTSRPYLRIRRNFRDLEASQPTIHLSGESQEEVDKIAREITAVISQRIESICERLELDLAEKQILQEGIAAVEHRTYLWIHLVFADIEEAVFLSKGDLRNSTRGLPRTVEEAYDKILRKSHDPVKARKILHIVVAADRPLRLAEMAAALALRESHHCHMDLDQDLIPPDRLHIAIRETCGLFVVVQDSQIFLLHQTAREFLVQLPHMLSETRSRSLEWQHSLNLAESHRLISDTCIRYLLLADFEQPGSRTPDDGHDFAFLDYGANNWTGHYRQAHNTSGTDLEGLALGLCHTDSPFRSNWLKLHGEGKGRWSLLHDLPTSLLVASYFGLDSLVDILLRENKVDISERSPLSQRTALSWASEKGHHLIVQSLLDQVTKRQVVLWDWWLSPTIVNREDAYGTTPLSYAAENGHQNISQQLLDRGAEVDTRDYGGRTPLFWAAQRGHSGVVALLLEWGARQQPKSSHLETGDRLGYTPLMEAAMAGNEVVVQLFLEHGAKVDACGGGGKTPLIWASLIGNYAIVKLLLEHGAKADVPGWDGRTPLIEASLRGHDAVVKLLLDYGAQVDAFDKEGGTALIYASFEGHVALLKLLLDYEAQVNACNKDGKTALMWASVRGHVTVVKLLLDYGAQVNACNKDGETALMWATDKGRGAVVELLLDRGAKVDAREKEGQTALRRALFKITTLFRSYL